MKLRWLASDLKRWRERAAKPVLVLTGARQVGKTTLAHGPITCTPMTSARPSCSW